jgi:tetratricopeptide (TPR) repeat protein
LLTTEGRAAATPTLQRAAEALLDISVEDVLRWGWIAPGAATAVWDDEAWREIEGRQVQIIRDAGALAELPVRLHALAMGKAWHGDFAGAGLLIEEADSLAAATGSQVPPFAVLRLRSLQGREAEASPLIEATIQQATAGGQGIAVMTAHWAAAVLYNGLARYDEAAPAARQVTANSIDPWQSMVALPELVEAATRIGDVQLARDALERLAETTQPNCTDWALGIEARCRALLSDGAAADDVYREATDRLNRTQLRPELARAHLLYGEWLRRQGRRVDAREQLRTDRDCLAMVCGTAMRLRPHLGRHRDFPCTAQEGLPVATHGAGDSRPRRVCHGHRLPLPRTNRMLRRFPPCP